MIHSANAEGVPSQKTRTHLSAKLRATRAKGSRVHALPLPRTRNQPIRRNARGTRDSKWTGQPLGCMVCAWPLLLAFQLGTLVAGILSNLKSKKLLGVVSVHNCSLRRSIISDALSCMCNTLPRFQQGIAGSSLAVSLPIRHPCSWLLKPDAMGASAYELRIARHREMTAAGADEPVPLALTNHKFELAVFYAVWATSLRHAWAPPRP
jgi:hypothetical protein